MDGGQAIIALVFVAILLVGTATAVTYASKQTAEEIDLNESTTTGSIGTLASFPNSNIEGAYYSPNATLKDENATLLTNGTDYRWYQTNATFEVLSNETANETVTGEYTLYEPSERQKAITTLLADTLFGASFVPLLLIIALVVIALAVFGGI